MADQMTLAEAIAAVDSLDDDGMSFRWHGVARVLRKALALTEDECRSLSALMSHQDIHLAKQEQALDAIALALKAAREEQPVTGSSAAGNMLSDLAPADSGPVAPEGDENRGNVCVGGVRLDNLVGRCPKCGASEDDSCAYLDFNWRPSTPASPRDATERPAEQAVGDGSRQGVPLRGVLPRSALDPQMPPGAATPSVTNECSYCGATGHSAGKCPVYRSKHGKDAYANATPGEQAVTRAVILSKSTAFQRWQGRNVHPSYRTEEHAARFIRYHCGIASRAELAANPNALSRFLALEAEYIKDTNQIAEVRG